MKKSEVKQSEVKAAVSQPQKGGSRIAERMTYKK
jgi:hypothetical protein